MYIRKTQRVFKGKTYTNHLLVESVQTPQGPRQRTICSLGSLEPALAEDWLGLAHKLQSALQGQASLRAVSLPVERLSRRAQRGKERAVTSGATLAIEVDRAEMVEAREAGPVHVGHQVWRQLGLDAILRRAGLSPRACTLTEAMTLNRLIGPRSEHAMPDWIRSTALGDILQENFSTLVDEALYRNLDRLHPQRETIERELAEREKTLFNLDDSIFLYDLTSTYFEGEAASNPQAKRGYSRDKRPDCKGRETRGWQNWRAKRAGKRSCVRPQRRIPFRKRPASRSSGSRKARWSTSSAAAQGEKKRIGRFAKSRKRSCSPIWPSFSSEWARGT
jgi:hypothetical protein